MKNKKAKNEAGELNILIRGYYGKKNLGDDYILYSLLKMLDDLTIEPKMSVSVESLGDDFSWLFPRFSNLICESLPISQKGHFAQNKDTRHYIKHKNLFIVGGGGLFPNLSWKMSAALYIDAILAKLHHSRFMLYGIDISRMKGRLSRFFWKKTASISEPIVLRNEYSRKMLANIGISSALGLTDLTFCTSTSVEKDPSKVEALEERFGLKGSKYVIFALANPFTSQEMSNTKYLSRFSLLVNELKQCRNEYEKNGFKIVFLPFFFGSDSFIIKKVADIEKDIVFGENDLDLEEKRAIFIHASAVFSMRFHGIAFALYHGIPCTAICYAPKSVALMEEAGLEDYVVKYGIRQTDSFFEEFDLDVARLATVNTKVIFSVDKKRFLYAESVLKTRSRDTRAILEGLFKNK